MKILIPMWNLISPLTILSFFAGCMSNTQLPTMSVNGPAIVARRVCIQINEQVPASNVISAIQVALHHQGIDSTPFSRGTVPPECNTVLEYSVVLDQCHDGNDPTNDEYWSSADISILQGGVVMTSVHYEANDYKRRSNDSHILISMIRSVISADRHEVAAF